MSKIAVEVRREHDLRPEVRRFLELSSRDGWQSGDLHYRKRCDLRGIKIPAIIHMHSRRTGNHQVELIEADTMGYTTIVKTLSSVVEGSPAPLRLTRIDLSADVPEIPVDWFRTHVRIPRKKTIEIYGKQCKAGNKRTSGLYFGGKHDLIRVYDKRQELSYKRKPLDLPFAAWGDSSAPTAITRVERQLRGAKIPAAIRDIQSLAGIAGFDPFQQVCFEMSHQMPFGGTKTARAVLASRGLQDLVEKEGPQVARSILNRHSGGKAGRLFRSLGRVEAIPDPDLYRIYRAEVLAQLEAA